MIREREKKSEWLSLIRFLGRILKVGVQNFLRFMILPSKRV